MAPDKNVPACKRFVSFLPGIAWFIIVMIVVFLPGDDVPDTGWLNISNFDKLIHAGLFGGIVFLFCFPFKKAPGGKREKRDLFVRITIATVIWGFTTELIQKYFIPGRQYDLADWLADSIGAFIAFFVSLKLFAK
ncbi:MAG: VanZ family protein [Ferruginibacter sp.]